MNLCNVLDFSR